MAEKSKPEFVHEIFSQLDTTKFSKTISDRVNQLVSQGYRVKVIQHDPVDYKIIGIGFLATIMATKSDQIDISN